MSSHTDGPVDYHLTEHDTDTEELLSVSARPLGTSATGAGSALAVDPAMSAGGGVGKPDAASPWRQPHRPPPEAADGGGGGEAWWADWQLPAFVVLFTVVGLLAITFVVLIWLKRHMLPSKRDPSPAPPPPSAPSPCGGGETQWIIHPVMVPPIQPSQPQHLQCLLAEVTSEREDPEPRKQQEPIRIKAKGLLERRGSSASLTIELLPTSQGPALVTPTRECTSEEYLLSAGNVLSRAALRLCLRDTRALHREFWDLPLNHPERAPVVGCGHKNRYRSILPNERTRVKLRSDEEDSLAEYINANFLRGYEGAEKAYIATQGPLPHTTADFWHLVWQENVGAVVMVTRLCEQGRVKCEQYLPLEVGACCTHGDIAVVLAGVDEREGHAVRELRVKRGDETRRLLHFWYETWPDHKTPAGARDLVSLAEEVEMLRRVGVDQYLANRASPGGMSTNRAGPGGISANRASPGGISANRASPGGISANRASPGGMSANRASPGGISANPTSPGSATYNRTSPTDMLPNQPSPRNVTPNQPSPRALSSNQSSPRGVLLNETSPLCVSANQLSPNDVYSNRTSPSAVSDVTLQRDATCNANSPLFNFNSQISPLLASTNQISPRNFSTNQTCSPYVFPDHSSPLLASTNQISPRNFSTNQMCSPYPFPDHSSPLLLPTNQTSPLYSSTSQTSPLCSLTSQTVMLGSSVDDGSCTARSTNESSVRGATPASDWASAGSGRGFFRYDGSSPLVDGAEGVRDEEPTNSEECGLQGPVLVHCSAGIGRTGCFIAVSVGINQLVQEGNVDILGIVCQMRMDRGGMIQTAEQYEFVHRALCLFEQSLPATE